MLTFLRRIRKSLIESGSTRRYILYALGEIALVVIGILIALQINNWNQIRKTKVKTNLLLEQTRNELHHNITRCNQVINHYWYRDTLIYKVLNKEVNYEEFTSNRIYPTLVTSFVTANLIDEAYNNLITNATHLSPRQDTIVLDLKDLYGTEKIDTDRLDLKMEALVDNYLEKLKNEKEWFSDFLNLRFSDEILAYFFTDPFHFNQLNLYYLHAHFDHLEYVMGFKHQAMNIYEDISDLLELETDSTIIKDVNDYQHYLGVYEYNSRYNIHIVQEGDQIIYNTIAKNDTIVESSRLIHPVSKEYFIRGNSIFGQFIFDNNNQVIKMITSKGSRRSELIKID